MLLHPKLSKVRSTGIHSLRHTDGLVSRRPYLAPLVALTQDYFAGVAQGSASALEHLLERQFLYPDRDSTLFELQVGFDVLAALQQLGYQSEGPMTLLAGGSVPFATLRGPAGHATIWWQKPAWVLDPESEGNSVWSQILGANGLSRHPLRPDFVLDLPQANRRLLIEVKLTALAEGSPERDGLRDVVAYLADAADLFHGYQHPHALVAAWNATGHPLDRATRIQVTDQHRIRDTLTEALR